MCLEGLGAKTPHLHSSCHDWLLVLCFDSFNSELVDMKIFIKHDLCHVAHLMKLFKRSLDKTHSDRESHACMHAENWFNEIGESIHHSSIIKTEPRPY